MREHFCLTLLGKNYPHVAGIRVIAKENQVCENSRDKVIVSGNTVLNEQVSKLEMLLGAPYKSIEGGESSDVIGCITQLDLKVFSIDSPWLMKSITCIGRIMI